MAEQTVQQLKDNETGRWKVTTESGTVYLVNLDQRTLRRQHASGGNDLRKDASVVRLIGVLDCRVGESAAFVLAGVSDDPDVVTTRQTTPVTSILRLPDVDVSESILADPTRCYADGCDKENELLMHLRDDPWGGADLCLEHARQAFRVCEVPRTCDCDFCRRARAVLADGDDL